MRRRVFLDFLFCKKDICQQQSKSIFVCSLIMHRNSIESVAQLYRTLSGAHFCMTFISISYRTAELCRLIRIRESYYFCVKSQPLNFRDIRSD